MRNDPFPQRPYLTDLEQIIEVKRGKIRRRLTRLRAFIPSAYCRFIGARNALDTLPARAWKAEAKAALQHCYSRSSKRNLIMKELQAQVVPAPFLCPYCLMRQPKSWDHYLPQNHFPEYSVFALNLVLICETCNRRKSDGLVATPRSVLNPYFDVLPMSPVLHAVASLGRHGIRLTFSVGITDPLAPGHMQPLIERHAAELGLLDEYEREGSAYVADVIASITALYRRPISQRTLDRALDAKMRGLHEFPVNSWQGAALEALEIVPNLLDYVNGKIATAPPAPRLRPRRDLTALRAAAAANALANP